MKLYRYEAFHLDDRVELTLQGYEVAWETPCGYWIYLNGPYLNDMGRCPKEVRKERPHEFKFVLKTTETQGKKRFAYATVEEAYISYRARKKRRVEILKGQLERAEKELILSNTSEGRRVFIDNPIFLKEPECVVITKG